MTVNMIPELEFPDGTPEFHADDTISLGELVTSNVFDFSLSELDWSDYAYSDEQYHRICGLFVDRYWTSEVSMLPLLDWFRALKARFILASQKYNDLYDIQASGGWNPAVAEDVWEKNRRIGSDFPASQISPRNQDYATDADDFESEKVRTNNPLEHIDEISRFESIDSMFLEYVARGMFTPLYTMNINGF